ncbi:MAG: hypothetical protein M1829_005435 [Trizodia sp. TS-e1964]|nr:MAG: hypothetical protein M1829_005435 [Trizodia sp. TS-e1964]
MTEFLDHEASLKRAKEVLRRRMGKREPVEINDASKFPIHERYRLDKAVKDWKHRRDIDITKLTHEPTARKIQAFRDLIHQGKYWWGFLFLAVNEWDLDEAFHMFQSLFPDDDTLASDAKVFDHFDDDFGRAQRHHPTTEKMVKFMRIVPVSHTASALVYLTLGEWDVSRAVELFREKHPAKGPFPTFYDTIDRLKSHPVYDISENSPSAEDILKCTAHIFEDDAIESTWFSLFCLSQHNWNLEIAVTNANDILEGIKGTLTSEKMFLYFADNENRLCFDELIIEQFNMDMDPHTVTF